MDNNIKTGVDIVDINRIERIFSAKKDKFLKKVFTGKEIEYFSKRKYKVNSIAGIFAAKEAISKVLGSGIGYINWHDIEVLHNERGKPYININAKLDNKMKELGLSNLDISISHERNYAIAFAIGIGYENHMNISMNSDIMGLLPKRRKDSHKGSYGRVAIIAGSL